MRGILGHAGYLPYRRLDRSTIAPVAGAGGGNGTRSVASYDEDTTTMGVEAGRLALAGTDATPAAVYFATTTPTYLDKTNATAIHAALRLADDVIAADLGGAPRSAVAALRLALRSDAPALVISADIRTGLPGSTDEAAGGDGAAALLVGSDASGEVVAELIGTGSATEEFLDRWRVPGEARSKQWEERFGEGRYVALGERAWTSALKDAGITGDEVTHLAVAGTHARATSTLAARLSAAHTQRVNDFSTVIGLTGAAQAGLLLSSALDVAPPGALIGLVSLADGADVLIFRVRRPSGSSRPVAAQAAAGALVSYGTFLAWRGMLVREPPRRPEPARISASAAGRNVDWKFGFVGSQSVETGAIQMPPSVPGAGAGEVEPVAMSSRLGTIATFTVDRLAYSPSPPVVFAVIDFDGGGRLPMELTDVDAADVAIGDRVELTFRRLSTADGIANYFWKARPVRSASGPLERRKG